LLSGEECEAKAKGDEGRRRDEAKGTSPALYKPL
jgi:hypothetical protein